MRSTPLLALILPLLGTGWVSLSAGLEVPVERIQPSSPSLSSGELPAVIGTPTSARELAAETTILQDETSVAFPPLEESEGAQVPLLALPLNPLLEEGASPERYAEWYRGTATEHLCQNLARLTAIYSWNPKTCSCVNPDLLLKHSARHELVHDLHEKRELLREEMNWLTKEVRRHVQADLASGGSLTVFRLPKTEERMKAALEGLPEEELWILGRLLIEAQREIRQATFEAEHAAGRYKLNASSWG